MTNSKHQVHNLIILDESGSMASIKSAVIDGFNETLKTIKQLESENLDQEHFVTFLTFGGVRFTYIHFAEPASRLQELNRSNFNPDDNTPLYDAIGMSCNRLKTHLADKADHDVIVTILTDGEENASREYSQQQIKALIEELQAGKWVFSYIGTEHDITRVALSLSIHATLIFSKNKEDMDRMFAKDRYSKRAYNIESKNFASMSDDEIRQTKEDYFDEEKTVERFKNAYDQMFDTALAEIRNGRKRSHWMWFIFPQIAGLGHSEMAVKYAVKDIHEARLILFEPYLHLRERLEQICEALLQLPSNSANKIFGYTDAMKLRSSMTLFSQVQGASPVFQRVLDKFFDGQPDNLTLDILKRP
ncbi:MAG: DUF1810 family protein [Prevotellaceae bacterium]|jgi:uncharacterized protein (DUF1810 family)|nr:DUF1810 family protein [Prevotellaceae bacterium]